VQQRVRARVRAERLDFVDPISDESLAKPASASFSFCDVTAFSRSDFSSLVGEEIRQPDA